MLGTSPSNLDKDSQDDNPVVIASRFLVVRVQILIPVDEMNLEKSHESKYNIQSQTTKNVQGYRQGIDESNLFSCMSCRKGGVNSCKESIVCWMVYTIQVDVM